MLQQDPLADRNFRINRRLEQIGQDENTNNNPTLPLQNVNISGNHCSKIAHTDSEQLQQNISEPTALSSNSNASPTNGYQMRLNVNFEEELEELETLILDSVRVPLTELVVIDEGLVLERIDSIRKQIPPELAIAINILQSHQEILEQAENYARDLIDSAKQQAKQIVEKSALVRQAELEATRIKIETQRECEQLRQKTQEEIESWRELAIVEYEDIQNGADEYARNVLGNLEGQLTQMLGIIRNGCQQLEPKTIEDRSN